MTTKFSQLNNVGVGITGDQLITLRSGLDVLTNYTVPVPLAGGTMTGYLILNADPTNPLGAATKQYVDAEVSGSVTSVTGTSLQIDASPTTGAVVVSIDSGYVGQTSITTLGTISSGTWAGTTIAVAHGGTGKTSFTAYNVICGGTSTTGALQNASGTMTSGYVLTANGTSSLPSWQAIVSGVSSVSGTSNQIDVSPTTGNVVVSIDAAYVGQTSITTLGTIATGVWNGSVIGLSYGGTNHALTASNGGIVWSDASKLNILSGTATAGQLLLSGSSATPAWSTSTYPATNAANTLLYASSSNTMAALATATSAVLTTVSSVPTWASDLSVGLGGTGNTTFTAYSVICAGTTATGAFQNVSGLGTSGYVLTSNGAAALPTWQAAAGGGIGTLDADSGSATGSTVTISGGSTGLTTSGSSATIDLTGTLVVANGGTGIATTTAYAVICGGTTATGAFQNVSGLGSSGYVLTSNGAGALPTWQAGGGGGTGITWNDQTSGTVTMAVNNGYVIDNGASLVTLTLPATAALGSLFIVAGKSAGGWIIDVASGQTIHVGSTASTASTGTVASSNQYDCITLVCVTANTTFVAYGIQGNVVVV
jgi:hypothetical protein